MQNYRECFKKVRKDCVRYIQSQETKKEKFKNKDQMIKSHIIPLCFWINKKRKNKKTLLVGLAGGCLLYTSPSPRDCRLSRMPSSA